MPLERYLKLKEGENNDYFNWPESFIDPLSQKPMENPVILISDGHSYEKNNINEWLKQNSTSPMTGENLTSMIIIENITLSNAIKEFVKNQTINFHLKKIEDNSYLNNNPEGKKNIETKTSIHENESNTINNTNKSNENRPKIIINLGNKMNTNGEKNIEIVKGSIFHAFDNIKYYLSLGIGVVGDPHVGKSSLIHSISNSLSSINNIEPTIAAEYLPFHLNKRYNGYPVAIYIHDTTGNERFYSITKQYVRQLRGVLMVCSLSQTDKNSFQNIKNIWYPFVKEYGKDDIIPILVCNKYDIYDTNANENENMNANNEEYSKLLSEIENFANENNIAFYNASAQTGFNVNQIFNDLISKILQNQQIFEELVDQKIYHCVVDKNTRRQYRAGSFVIDEGHVKQKCNENKHGCCLNS